MQNEFQPDTNGDLEKLIPIGELLQASGMRSVSAFRARVRDSGDANTYEQRYVQAQSIALKPETDHSGLINYLSLGLFRAEVEDSVRLPSTLNLSKFGPVFTKLLQSQMATGREHGRTATLNWKTLRLSFSAELMGGEKSVYGAEVIPDACNEFHSFHVHTHPTRPGQKKSDVLNLSCGDLFTLEANVLGATAVVCEAGALIALKRGGCLSLRSPKDTVAILKGIRDEVIARRDLTPSQKGRAITGRICKAFDYDLYRIASLEEMVARRIDL